MTALMGRDNGSGFARDHRFGAPPSHATPEGSALPFAAFRGNHAAPPIIVPQVRAPDPVEVARGQAYAQGHAEGYAQAEHEAQEREAMRDRFAATFQRIDAESAEQLRQRLMATVVALCEAALAPIALDKAALATRIERAVAMFTRADDDRVIRLNAQDMAAVQDQLPPDWTFSVDDTLEPGALRVEARSRGVDGGGVEDGPAQWRRAIAEALDLGTPDPENDVC